MTTCAANVNLCNPVGGVVWGLVNARRTYTMGDLMLQSCAKIKTSDAFVSISSTKWLKRPDVASMVCCSSYMLLPKGVVRTALPDLDREVRDSHLLVVQAKDMIGQIGGLSGSTSVTVILTDVNDNPPHFPRRECNL